VRGGRVCGGARGGSSPGIRGGRRSCFRHGCRRSGARLRRRRASALRRATSGFPARLTLSGRPCGPEGRVKKGDEVRTPCPGDGRLKRNGGVKEFVKDASQPFSEAVRRRSCSRQRDMKSETLSSGVVQEISAITTSQGASSLRMRSRSVFSSSGLFSWSQTGE